MPEALSAASQTLELFLNCLEFIALVASIATFFFLMLNQFSKALKDVLGPCGLTLIPRVRVLFLCRKSPSKKRAFLEFAILKTEGYTAVSGEWNSIINEFKACCAEGQTEYTYTIPNCTILIGGDFSNATERYFKYFKSDKAKKAFGIRDERIGWVTKIHIEEAYATPTCLLTGLLSRYEENWHDFINRYVSTAYITEAEENEANAILSDELYSTFAWLLWGPSYEINYRKYWAGLFQISYGDESNSIPVVVCQNSDVPDRLSARFSANEERRYGALISADLSLYDNQPYYEGLRDGVNPANSYFYDRIEGGTLSFAVQMDDFSPCENYKAKKYYCTAYVWLLFEVENQDGLGFRPEKSVAFFEHANLTDKENYQFLIGTLIDKSIKHFSSIFSVKRFEGRKYRFVCAMNDKIAEEFRKRYDEITSSSGELAAAFRERLVLESKYMPTEVFAAYDEYFVQSNSLEYVEVSLKDKATISDLGKFYTDVYMDCFPNDDERESFDNLLFYLKQAGQAEDYRYHIILAKNEHGDVVGGGIFDYFMKTSAGIIEFLAVRGDVQSGGIGSLIYKHIVSVLAADARNNNGQKLKNVFCEIDSPEYSKASIKKYLHFWDKHKYKHLDFTYIQPSLSATQSAVDGLWLTIANMNDEGEPIGGEYVLSVLHDYMKYAMKIKDPLSHPDYLRMREELAGRKSIPLQPIV